MKRPVAIFDFCDTIVGLQSADRFIEFVTAQTPTWYTKCIDAIYWPIKRMRLMPSWIGKRMIASKLRGYTTASVEPQIDRYVQEVLLPHAHEAVIDAIRTHLNNGDAVYIVSAGYTPYIEAFAKTLDSRITVVATDLAVHNDRYTGRFQGKNCYRGKKIEKLQTVLDLQTIDTEHSHVYSDSLSDMPLFTLVNNKHFVVIDSDTTTAPEGFSLFRVADSSSGKR